MNAQPLRCPTCDTRFDAASGFCTHDGARLVPAAGDADALVGNVLADRYRIVKLLGQGGMGRVYEAQHVNINKRLAIKVLRSEVTAVPSTVARFRQEARSASSIGHENIIEIEDFATLPDGTVYLAMEMLEGISLGDRMRQTPAPSLSESVEVMIPVGRGLAAAHEKGIVHRDMKPENVFLAAKHGRVIPKILDFGIAKVSAQEGGNHLTQTGAIFGTPLYMSPEQAMGQPLDHRADIYSVGVILYELAVGRVPFKADSAVQVLSQHITTAPEPPSKAAPNRKVPPELDAIILKAMAKDPKARYQKMTELVEDLLSLQRQLPAVATSQVPIKDTAPQAVALGKGSQLASQLDLTGSRQSRTPFIIIAAVLLLVLVVGGLMMLRQPTPPVATLPIDNKQAVPIPAEPKPAPPIVETVEVVVSTVPPGAKVMRAGVPLVETPDAIKMPSNETWNVVLHKDGYADQPVTIDPSRDRKVLVKLDKEGKTVSGKAGSKAANPKTATIGSAKTTAPAQTAIIVPMAQPKPVAQPKPPSDSLGSAVDMLAATSAPGAKRMGGFYSGHANEEDEHTDWFMTLEQGRCYAYVATGGPGVKELYVYLWGPRGNRVTDRREGSPGVTLQYCATQTASYHFQAKVADGSGDYKVGLYVK